MLISFLQIFCEDTSTITYSVMAEVSLNSLHAPTFVSRKVFTHVVFQGNGITDIYALLQIFLITRRRTGLGCMFVN